MKKTIKIICTAIAVFVCIETKRKQKKAKNEGCHIPYGPYEAVLKRPLDVLITGMALVPLLPVIGFTALLVKIKLGSPVLFTQQRPGKDEKLFTLYKFRTMTDETDENGKLLPDEERLTGFGKWLRSTSLDELPELFNILKGDMSLVGPRPLLEEYLPVFTDREKMRHIVRPGLTGLAQIRGRNFLAWDKRLETDVHYVEHLSLKLDVFIIFKTLKMVFKREGVASEHFVESNLAKERRSVKREAADTF